MAQVLSGKEVAAALNERIAAEVEELKAQGVEPTLAILRVGERADDLSYERGATKRADSVGVAVKKVVLPEDTDRATLLAEIEKLNADDSVHGVLMFRPLPNRDDDEAARNALAPEKDIDGITDGSMVGVFANTKQGFAPCTAQACIEILDHYGIDPKGKRVTIIGRSLVIGRPVAMMLMHRHATITICHTRTIDIPSITKEADIVLAAAGVMESVDASYFKPGQIASTWESTGTKSSRGSAAMSSSMRSSPSSTPSPRFPVVLDRSQPACSSATSSRLQRELWPSRSNCRSWKYKRRLFRKGY